MKNLLLIFSLSLLLGAPAWLPGQGKTPYEELTKEAAVRRGAVTVILKDNQYYLEVPQSIFGRDFIWYAEISKSPLVQGAFAGESSPGSQINNRIVRLERRGDKVFIRDYTAPLDLRTPYVLADQQEARIMKQGLAETNVPPILMAIPIVSEGPDGSVVLDASSFFIKNLEQFDAKGSLPGAVMQDLNRSYVVDIQPFETNLRITTLLTFKVTESSNPMMAAFAKINSQAATIEVQHSLYRLPEDPMQPRLADPRVGYFKTQFQELRPGGGVESKAYISRYRLEKKNPSATLSEPVKPIVYYIGPNVPERYRPVFKEAVEMWNAAFEAAGFRNAIIAKDPPDDPDWDPNDLGYSVIRWLNQPTANAKGPSVVDPRTGEILSAHVLIWENVTSIAAKWYYMQASASDPRARQLPLPDDVLKEIMRYVVAHEVGHTLGLRHNHRASQAYTIEQLRDPAFANANGPVASIMSYGRMNYVAQPGDGVTRMIPKISPYDKLAIKYGYEPIPGAFTPEAEVPTLNQWLLAQRDDVTLQFGGEDLAAQFDPMVLTENIGSDRIEAAELGMKNLQRAMDYLPQAVGESPQDIAELKRYYKSALDERQTWLTATAKELYGVVENRTLDPREKQYEVVSPARKRKVVQYLLSQLEKEPELITPEMRRIYMPYELSPLLTTSQTTILGSMLDPKIFQSTWEAELVGEEAYTIAEYLDDIQKGLFSELNTGSVAIDPMRRSLQRTYVEILKGQLEGAGGISSGKSPDLRGAIRLVLKELNARLEMARKKASGIETRAHLYDLQKEIESVL